MVDVPRVKYVKTLGTENGNKQKVGLSLEKSIKEVNLVNKTVKGTEKIIQKK